MPDAPDDKPTPQSEIDTDLDIEAAPAAAFAPAAPAAPTGNVVYEDYRGHRANADRENAEAGKAPLVNKLGGDAWANPHPRAPFFAKRRVFIGSTFAMPPRTTYGASIAGLIAIAAWLLLAFAAAIPVHRFVTGRQPPPPAGGCHIDTDEQQRDADAHNAAVHATRPHLAAMTTALAVFALLAAGMVGLSRHGVSWLPGFWIRTSTYREPSGAITKETMQVVTGWRNMTGAIAVAAFSWAVLLTFVREPRPGPAALFIVIAVVGIVILSVRGGAMLLAWSIAMGWLLGSLSCCATGCPPFPT
jgi:hypothetical protein